MSFDCTNYESCPKWNSYNEQIYKKTFNYLFVGCWGVYCKYGINPVVKYKKDFIYDKGTYGQKYVVDSMIKYTNENGQVDAVILAGDNVYSDIPDQERMRLIEEGTESIYNIERQISIGFEKCMKYVNTKEFLLGIGNHDIENCHILNKQINYDGWRMPGIAYNILYKTDEMTINLIFIDTNMYEQKWCQGMYPEYAISEQRAWLDKVLINNNNIGYWNIVIGHIPFIANPHKKIDDNDVVKPRMEKILYKLIQDYANKIDLYMCADEHNQQYITVPNMPPQVIAGSGGALLDENIYTNSYLNEYTQLYRSTFGFVSTEITSTSINLGFYGVKEYPEHNNVRSFQIVKNI